MPRTSTKRKPETDELSPEQKERALLLYHFDRLRKQEVQKLAKKAEYDVEASALTDLFREAKADGFTRKELQALLDDTAAVRRDLTADEERRARLRAYVGLPAGTQLDLFASPLEVQDEQHAQGQGYAAGLRGDPGELPTTIQPRFAQAFLRGWGKGQEELAWALAEAGRIVDRRKDASANPVELQPEPEEENEVARASRELGDQIKAEEAAAEGQEEPDPSQDSSSASPASADWAEPQPEEQQFAA